jgi:hypothetical protein
MKCTVDKLYKSIIRLITVIEDELDIIGDKKSKSRIVIKKNIADMLCRLVPLVIQLNKLSKEESLNTEIVMPEEDKRIIEQFLAKHNREL